MNWNSIYRVSAIMAIGFSIFVAANPSRAEEWYIPKRTEVLEQGSLEFGTRVQYMPDESMALNSRSVELIPSLRYSPINRLELYVEGSFLRRDVEQFVGGTIQGYDDQGAGDIFAQVSFDAISREDWKLILGVDGTFPTGNDPYENTVGLGGGFYRVSPGITYMKVIDPVVLFAYAGYQWSFAETFNGVGKLEPGDDFRFRLGASLLLNPRVRASVYTTADIVDHTKLNGVNIVGSDGDNVRVGGSIGWTIDDD